MKLKGKRLKKGDTIGIVAPANNARREDVLEGKKKIEKLGYKVILSKSIFDRWHSFAGQDQDRISDINDFFKDPDIDAIICLRGGYGSIRMVEELDIDIVKANPKIFIGYSDITTLHTKLNRDANLITFHGPMVTSNFLDIDDFTLESLLQLVENPTGRVLVNPVPLKRLSGGIAIGEVVGGNLITLMGDMGTPNQLDLSDKILFIEEINEPTYKIDRALTQLLNSGELNKVKGIILGDFNNCGKASEDDISLMELFEDRLLGLGVPIIYNFKSGHCKPMVTLPLGGKIKLDCNDIFIEVLEGTVK
jgi:muramoyltetrapeptide carboxypeptidase